MIYLSLTIYRSFLSLIPSLSLSFPPRLSFYVSLSHSYPPRLALCSAKRRRAARKPHHCPWLRDRHSRPTGGLTHRLAIYGPRPPAHTRPCNDCAHPSPHLEVVVPLGERGQELMCFPARHSHCCLFSFSLHLLPPYLLRDGSASDPQSGQTSSFPGRAAECWPGAFRAGLSLGMR